MPIEEFNECIKKFIEKKSKPHSNFIEIKPKYNTCSAYKIKNRLINEKKILPINFSQKTTIPHINKKTKILKIIHDKKYLPNEINKKISKTTIFSNNKISKSPLNVFLKKIIKLATCLHHKKKQKLIKINYQ